VARKDNGAATFPNPASQVDPDALRQVNFQSRKWLIQQKQLGIGDECTRNSEPALLSA